MFNRGDSSIQKTAALQECKKAGYLAEFRENLSMEEMNMPANEWDMDTAFEVWKEEGMERGIEMGMEMGIERGRNEGKEETARNALAKGLPLERIREITGLDMEAIKRLTV